MNIGKKMFKSIKTLAAATAFAVAAPVAAFAVTITGQIDFSGVIDNSNSTFSTTGSADLADYATVIYSTEAVETTDAVALTDIDFSAPGEIWSVGGFTFTATSFANFTNNVVSNTFGFDAVGVLSADGFDDTAATFSLTTQSDQSFAAFSATTYISADPLAVTSVPLPAGVLLMGSALAGFGMIRRKKA
jgi:hypothetical protein